jgi:hypothetical protein
MKEKKQPNQKIAKKTTRGCQKGIFLFIFKEEKNQKNQSKTGPTKTDKTKQVTSSH